MRPFVKVSVVVLLGSSLALAGTSAPEPQTTRIIVRVPSSATVNEISMALERSSAGSIESIKTLFPERGAMAVLRGEEERVRQRLTESHLVSVASDKPVETIVEALKSDPGIIDAEPDRLVELQETPDDPFFVSSGSWGQSYEDLWGLHVIDAVSAWNLTTGSRDVVIAVIDSGLDLSHPDIQGNIWVNDGEIPENGIDDDDNGYVDDVNGWNFADDTNNVNDDHAHGHGTHVSGTIAAVGNNAFGVAGVMWEASVMPLKGFNVEGVGYESDLAVAIVYAAENGARITNNSWGKEGAPSQLIRDAFAYARSLGVTSVVAAGNDGIKVGTDEVCFFSPACLDDVMTIAASNHHDERAYFSNYGRQISVSAPGGGTRNDPDVPDHPLFNVLSLRAGAAGSDDLVVGGAFYRLAGTSMATPHAAGLAGLVLSRQAVMVPGLLQIVIEGSADDIGEPGRDDHTGFGRINAYEAVLLADTAVTLPELAISGLRPSKSRAAPGSPVQVEIDVVNVGIATNGVVVVLSEGQLSNGGNVLREWTVDLDANEAIVLETVISLDGLGRRALIATVDPEDHVLEVTERNNHTDATLVLSSYYFSETALTEDPADQVNPSISSTHVVYEDHRGEESEIVLFDIARREAHRLREVESSLRAPSLWGRHIAWADCERKSCRVFHHDLGPDGRFGTADDIGPTQISGVVNDVSTISGSRNRIVWSDARYGNQDVFVHDLTTSEVRRITGNDRADVYADVSGDWLFWERWLYASPAPNGLPNIVGRNLATGVTLELAVSDAFHGRPSISAGRIVWEDWRTGDGDLFMYDFGTEAQRPLISTPGAQRNPSLSGNQIAWEDERDGNREIYFLDLDFGEELRLTHDLHRQRNPVVADGRVAWQDERNGNWDIYLATREGFPAPPIHLAATRSDRTVTLDWQSSGEGTVIAYGVYRRASEAESFALIATSPIKCFEDEGLDAKTDYHYRVTAIDSYGGESPYSDEVAPRTTERESHDEREATDPETVSQNSRSCG